VLLAAGRSGRDFAPGLDVRKQRWTWTALTIVVELLVVAGVTWRLGYRAPGSLGPAPAGASSIVGVHTRLSDEVEESKIRRTTGMVREMGAAWMVELFPWAYVEPTKGSFDWGHSDVVVRAANEQGLTLVARLDFVPAWARPKDTTPRYLDSEHFADYAEFVHEFVRRYRGSIRYYAIWNEPNTSFEWGYRPVDPVEYTRLLKMAYEQVKSADPDAQVLPAGLAPTLEESPLGLNDLVFLQRMYDAGARDYFDVMNVHAYGWTLPPDDPPAPDRINFARVALVREVMVRNGDAAKPVVIAEAGWNDHPRWAKAVRPGQRIEYTIRAYQKAAEEWPWVLALNVWVFRLPVPAHNYNDYFTFVDTEFRPKPIYEAVKQYASR